MKSILALSINLLIFAAPAFAQKLESGDLIFHTSTSPQSKAIQKATGSRLSHMGVIDMTSGRPMVIEGRGTSHPAQFNEFINRDPNRYYVIYRFPNLTDDQKLMVVREARAQLGRPYDKWFTFHNSAIYCSELAWNAFRGIAVSLGTVQKVGQLSLGSEMVKQLMRDRAGQHPLCARVSRDQCRANIFNDDIITPISIARDRRLLKVHNTYPWYYFE